VLQLQEDDRLLIIVPHPDDESLGCGGIIQRAMKMMVPVKVVYLTYGDANEWSFIKFNKFRLPTLRPKSIKKMGQRRYQEALNACQKLGLSKKQISFLGYPDFGTLRIWYKHWGAAKPARGLFTRATSVPYDNAYRPGASFRGDEILHDLKSILLDFKPTRVFTSHRLDFNADHQALYLYVRVALWDIKQQLKPKFHPFLTHFHTWPQPRGLKPNTSLTPPPILENQLKWISFELQHHEIAGKLHALNQHVTQMSATPTYLMAFIRKNELFGDYHTLLTKDMLDEELHQEGAGYLIQQTEEGQKIADEEEIGLDHHSIIIEDGELVESVHLTRQFHQDAIITFYIFPYSFGRDFGKEPKYRIKVKRRGIEFKNVEENMDVSQLKLTRNKENRELTLRFPMKLLNHADILLINVRSELRNRMVDWIPWRIIKM